jgi:Tol biopolymer transport system component
MKRFSNAAKTWIPLAVYGFAMLVVGCGGAGGGGSATGGLTGGNTTGTTGTSSTTGTSGTSGTTGSTTGTTGTTGGTGGTTGGSVVFLSDMDGPLAIYRMNVDGTGLAQVSNEVDLGGPCLSWAGDRIAFEKWDLYADLYGMDADGSNVGLIYQPGQDCQNPCFSPDGQYVIFSMPSGGVPQLFRTTVAGTGLTQLTNEFDGVHWGRYSPDGSVIVYATASGDVDVKIMNADGTGASILAGGPEAQDMPSFSPDGMTVVFIQDFGSAFDPNYQVMTVPTTGGTPARMTTTLEDDRSPCFSEDGAYLVFTRGLANGREIFRMSAGGGSATQVTTFNSFTGWLSARAG